MSIFLNIGCLAIPRIAGFGDRDASSKTYGCFDRAYWHYKTIDYPNGRFQEAALSLALASTIVHENNRYHDSYLFKEWAKAAVSFWLKSNNKDGSSNESYPHEHHFCATALSLRAISECLLLLNIPADEKIKKTGQFLIRHDNNRVANQVAGAAAALYNLFLLTAERCFKDGAEKKLKTLLSMQTDAGFFLEYGGFDLGYDTITLSLLASIYQKTKREDVAKAARRSIEHMKLFIDEEGYYFPETMSRRTQFIYPFGIAVFDPALLKKIENGLNANTILNPLWLDDRYCIPMTNDYLQCAAELLHRQ